MTGTYLGCTKTWVDIISLILILSMKISNKLATKMNEHQQNKNCKLKINQSFTARSSFQLKYGAHAVKCLWVINFHTSGDYWHFFHNILHCLKPCEIIYNHEKGIRHFYSDPILYCNGIALICITVQSLGPLNFSFYNYLNKYFGFFPLTTN